MKSVEQRAKSQEPRTRNQEHFHWQSSDAGGRKSKVGVVERVKGVKEVKEVSTFATSWLRRTKKESKSQFKNAQQSSTTGAIVINSDGER